jgi:hypothetical protein
MGPKYKNEVQICSTFTIISIFILQLRAMAPISVTNSKTSDVMAARTFLYEKRTELCRDVRRYLEQCRMFAKRDNRSLKQADDKNWTLIFLLTSETMCCIKQIASLDERVENTVRFVVVKRICEVLCSRPVSGL